MFRSRRLSRDAAICVVRFGLTKQYRRVGQFMRAKIIRRTLQFRINVRSTGNENRVLSQPRSYPSTWPNDKHKPKPSAEYVRVRRIDRFETGTAARGGTLGVRDDAIFESAIKF